MADMPMNLLGQQGSQLLEGWCQLIDGKSFDRAGVAGETLLEHEMHDVTEMISHEEEDTGNAEWTEAEAGAVRTASGNF